MFSRYADKLKLVLNEKHKNVPCVHYLKSAGGEEKIL